ncbi:hypothetical protein PQE68_gp043 [Bacillus phage vB_BanS_Sophrita]|uniref:Uncharacterized protein n=1 Tax=Bacillus phage vB_BanS_Sophrita TaxID=2894790 RepID=A0AAE9CDW5_9CAUD|nr:hypothetical protein PQE68_gp043 [Bacillus phage vB_BanS_Sophrita]UGO50634.1 hypothetical protein SOPHRITA_43 [Bacillus phage vB_BanS_Sophrita]
MMSVKKILSVLLIASVILNVFLFVKWQDKSKSYDNVRKMAEITE